MLKKLIAGAVTAAVLGAGSLAVAGAVGSSGSSTTTTPSAQSALGHKGVGLFRRAAAVAAKTIGVSVTDLRAAVQSGQTVADVANAHHVAPQTVVSALVTAADQRIDAAVQAGHLSTDRAAKLKARVPKLADAFVNNTQTLLNKVRSRVHHRVRAAGLGLKDAAAAIGISPTELRSDLANGQTVADVAAAHHVDLKTLESTLVADATKAIDAAVKAGKLAPKAAQRIEQRLPQLVDRRVHQHFNAATAATASTSA